MGQKHAGGGDGQVGAQSHVVTVAHLPGNEHRHQLLGVSRGGEDVGGGIGEGIRVGHDSQLSSSNRSRLSLNMLLMPTISQYSPWVAGPSMNRAT